MGFSRFFLRFWKWDSRRKISWISRYLNEEETIMDLGSGPGWVSSFLRERGHDVTSVDVVDKSVAGGTGPLIYDGAKLPFEDKHFDVCLLLTVLHHAEDPVSVLREAARTSRRLIIIEDVHRGRIHGILVKLFDSLMNLEFRGHPHNNLDDDGWKDLFRKEGFKLTDAGYHRIGIVFEQVVYQIDCRYQVL